MGTWKPSTGSLIGFGIAALSAACGGRTGLDAIAIDSSGNSGASGASGASGTSDGSNGGGAGTSTNGAKGVTDSCAPPADSGRWAAGRRIYVDDTPGCEGLAPCFASLSKALEGAASDGDTISFLPGVHRGAHIAQSKTIQNLRLTSERGAASTTITGSCLDIMGEEEATGEIWVDHLTFRNCGPTSSSIEDGWGVFVDTWKGVNVRVQDNVFVFVGNNGRGAVGLFSATVGSHFAATVARNQLLDNHGEAGALDIDLPADGGEVYCIRVENNVLSRNRAAIDLGYHPFKTNPSVRFEFVNNTLARNDAGLGLPGPAASSHWFNNIFFDNKTDMNAYTDLTPVYEFRNNVIESGILTGQNGNFSADPQFRSATDLHLQPGSPAARAGTVRLAPPDDVDGTSRSMPPDIGAYAMAEGGTAQSSVRCGDGVVQRGDFHDPSGTVVGFETCDDGNTQDGDGCSSHCQFEPFPPHHAISEQPGSLCAVRLDHTVSCWGEAASNVPSGSFDEVAVSNTHACALRVDGRVTCWNGYAYAPAGSYRHITSDYARTCALRMDGGIDCWSDPDTLRSYPGSFVDISVDVRVCGLSASGQPTCFDPYVAQLPTGPFVQFIPSAGPDWCALDPTGKFTCSNGPDPAATPFYGGLVSLAVSNRWACGIRPDGRATCWRSSSVFSPPEDHIFIEVTAGFESGCGLTPDHRVHCWGSGVESRGYPQE